MTPTDSKRPSARSRLLAAASALFYADGIAATGIDTITDKAGVAKQSLYNNFPSKAALVSAYIENRHAEWIALYEARLVNTAHGADGILAVFDAYIDHACLAYEHGFRGCGLLNAAAELAVGDPARNAVRQHKLQVEALLLSHLEEMFPVEPQRASDMARQLAFLLEGAVARAGLDGDSRCLDEARAFAVNLLAH